MKIFLFLIFNLIWINIFIYGQSPTINWQRCYGGSENDWGRKIIKGRNNDLIIVGDTRSSDGDINGGFDSTNVCWFRLDTTNVIINRQTFSGSRQDISKDVIPAWNNGYIILGSTNSTNGDITGNHGGFDIWIIKISIQGVMQWQKCLGGSKDEFANSIIKTSDSCYVITGMTMSDDGDVSVNHGLPNTNDAWLIKVDLSGNILWEVTYGGPNGDYGQHVIETSDKGFLIAGSTYSNAGQVSGNNGALDVWVIKTDSLGTLEWQHCYGGSFLDAGYKAVEVNNHYYLFGSNESNDGDVTNNHPNNGIPPSPSSDSWLICIDSSGILQWEKSYGGERSELGWDVIYKYNCLFLICESSSSDGDVGNNHFNTKDYWVIQTDLQGNILWQSCFGGSDYDYAQSILVENNHLYALGETPSNDGDVSGNHGRIDFWLLDLNIESLLNNKPEISEINFLSIYPNPVNGKLNINIKEEAEIILEDVNGKVLRNAKINYNLSEDVSELPNGIYILKIISKKQIQYNKLFIIQH